MSLKWNKALQQARKACAQALLEAQGKELGGKLWQSSASDVGGSLRGRWSDFPQSDVDFVFLQMSVALCIISTRRQVWFWKPLRAPSIDRGVPLQRFPKLLFFGRSSYPMQHFMDASWHGYVGLRRPLKSVELSLIWACKKISWPPPKSICQNLRVSLEI